MTTAIPAGAADPKPVTNRWVLTGSVSCAVLVAAISLFRISRALPNDALLDHVSGVWITMASDLAEGVFYRPFFSETGYGGSRYFPLHFALQALLIKAGVDPIRSGYIIDLCSAAALVTAVSFFLRRFGLPPAFSAATAVLILAPPPVQHSITTIRGDLLPAALNAWGLFFAARLLGPSAGRSDVRWAGLFFGLAFSAKATSVFGLAAAFLALYFANRRKKAWQVLAWAVALMIIFLAVASALSRGRLLDYMLECGAGGITWETLRQMPGSILRSYGIGVILVLLGLGAILSNLPKTWTTLPALWAMTSLVATSVLFASPGVWFNHLVDPLAAVVVAFAAIMWARKPQSILLFLLPVAATLCLFGSLLMFGAEDGVPERAHLREVAAAAPASEKPLLAENNLIPLLNHERPYLLDCFSFRALALKDPAVGRRLREDLRQHRFRAVILYCDPGTESGREWYRDTHFGPGFAEAVCRSYRLHARTHDYFIFVPEAHNSRSASARDE